MRERAGGLFSRPDVQSDFRRTKKNLRVYARVAKSRRTASDFKADVILNGALHQFLSPSLLAYSHTQHTHTQQMTYTRDNVFVISTLKSHPSSARGRGGLIGRGSNLSYYAPTTQKSIRHPKCALVIIIGGGGGGGGKHTRRAAAHTALTRTIFLFPIVVRRREIQSIDGVVLHHPQATSTNTHTLRVYPVS